MSEVHSETGAWARRVAAWLDGEAAERTAQTRVVQAFLLAQLLVLAIAVAIAPWPVAAASAALSIWQLLVLRALRRGARTGRCAHAGLAGLALFCAIAWWHREGAPPGALSALCLSSLCLLEPGRSHRWFLPALSVLAVGAVADSFAPAPPHWLFDGMALLATACTLAVYRRCAETAMRTLRRLQESGVDPALYDETTGLANRALLDRRMAEALEHARRNGSLVGVISIHLAGRPPADSATAAPLIAQEAARRLRACLRQTDLAARADQADFIVMLCNLKSRRGMEVVLRRVQAALAEPVALPGGTKSGLRVRLGAALFPFDAELSEDLLDAAHADAERESACVSKPLIPAIG